MSRNLFRTLFFSILFVCVYFVSIDKVKADCDCYYSWTVNGANESVTNENYFSIYFKTKSNTYGKVK